MRTAAIDLKRNKKSMGNVVVAKFGGTSVADIAAFRQCAKIIQQSPRVKVVVVSAQSGMTNILVELAQKAKTDTQIKECFTRINAIISPMLQQINQPEVTSGVQHLLADLNFLVQMSQRLHSKQLSDEILSFGGERISASIVSAEFINQGIDAKHIDSRAFMLTDSHFGQAKPDIQAIGQKAKDLCLATHQAKVIVCEGFIGADKEGNTTTLGRGGSDYSAAFIAQAIKAKALKIWTDVDGIYEADPRVIENANVIDSLSFNEAAELATFGAKVLHPATLWPAISENIDVFVGSTFCPDFGGTWITKTIENTEQEKIRAVAERKNQILLTIKSYNMFHAQGFLARVFAVLAAHNVSVDLVSTSEVSVALILDHIGGQSMGNSLLTDELHQIGNIDICVEEGLSLIAIIGNQLHQYKGVSGDLFYCLREYNIRLFSHGASGHNICMLIDQTQSKSVMSLIYQQFFNTQARENLL